MNEALDRDQAQQLRHGCRQLAAHAEIMWEALIETELPTDVVDDCFRIWWQFMFTPKMELPDFSSLFRTDTE